MEIPRLFPLWVALGLLVGCASSPEPESAFEALPPQSYSFDTVWECLIEAAEDLRFTIADSSRDGERGDFTTDFVVTFTDSLNGKQRGQRLHARIAPGAVEDTFDVSLAASKFARAGGGDWSYVQPDEELRARFEAAFHRSLGARYKTSSQDEGY